MNYELWVMNAAFFWRFGLDAEVKLVNHLVDCLNFKHLPVAAFITAFTLE